MISLKRKESGFTIVELLIVIVVIGILAALVITTFSGIQQKARNTERETDLKSLHGQLEAYYAQENRYPTLDELNQTGTGNANWRADNMKGLDPEALKDPKGTTQVLSAGAATEWTYGYALDGNGKYTIQAVKEGGDDGEVFSKAGLN